MCRRSISWMADGAASLGVHPGEISRTPLSWGEPFFIYHSPTCPLNIFSNSMEEGRCAKHQWTQFTWTAAAAETHNNRKSRGKWGFTVIRFLGTKCSTWVVLHPTYVWKSLKHVGAFWRIQHVSVTILRENQNISSFFFNTSSVHGVVIIHAARFSECDEETTNWV